MASTRQRAAARRNIRKAAPAAKRKRTIAHLPKRTRTAPSKQAARVDVQEIGRKLVEVCRAGRNLDALDLYGPNAVTVEAQGSPEMPALMKGVDAIRKKGEWWFANNEIHRGDAKGPFPNGDRFAVIFEYDFTPKAGPQAGKRTRMEEVGLYTVENGRIVREEFFYSMS
jgi:SnoaL-like domain